MRINSIEDKKKIEGDDREFLLELDQLLGIKNEVQNRLDSAYKEEIKSEPVMHAFRKVFLPFAFLVLDEARELILEKLAEERIKEKI